MSRILALGQRRTCSNCGKRRKINAFWADKKTSLCKPCSRTPGMAFAYSVRERP